MRIGIITQPLRTNYGGLLQAYALQTVLERQGYHVEVLDTPYKRTLPLWRIPFSLIKRLLLKYLFRRNAVVFYEHKFNIEYPVISQYTNRFILNYIKRVEIKNYNKLEESRYDVLIVGSDQVWRPKYNQNIYKCFFDFAENWKIIRIAYAASFGTDKWEFSYTQTQRCAQLAKKFDLITTREDSGVELCQKYLGVHAQHVLDPTLLLKCEDYNILVSSAIVSPCTGDLMTYILDESPEIQSIIGQVALKKSLRPFSAISHVENIQAPLNERIQPPVEQWLYSFQNAKFVITDSFHACAFSIIYNIPFAVLGNPRRGEARFYSLLRMFGLEDRLVSTVDQIIELGAIDWNRINIVRNNLKEKSLSLLLSFLDNQSHSERN